MYVYAAMLKLASTHTQRKQETARVRRGALDRTYTRAIVLSLSGQRACAYRVGSRVSFTLVATARASAVRHGWSGGEASGVAVQAMCCDVVVDHIAACSARVRHSKQPPERRFDAWQRR